MTEEDRQRLGLQRYALIDPVVGRSLHWGEKTELLREQAQKHGLSVSTLKRYCRRFKGRGLDGLLPKRCRADKNLPRAISPQVLTIAAALRAEVPQRTTPTLIAMLERLHPELRGRVCRSTLNRHLRTMRMSRKHLRGTASRRRRQFSKTSRGALWHADLCILPLQAMDQGGRTVPVVVIAFLDDATRLLVHLEAYAEQTAAKVEDCFKKAALKCGLPLTVLFDHGVEFAAEHFVQALERLGVRVVNARPGSPESKGKLERFFLTLQTSLLPELKSLEETLSLPLINRYLTAWVEEVYHQRVHRELPSHLPTPKKRWDDDPTPLRKVDPIRLEAACMMRVNRKVGRTQLVEVGGKRYLADQAKVGSIVEVRYHPLRPESVQIWHEDELAQIAYRYVVPEDVLHPMEAQPLAVGSASHNLASMWLAEYEAGHQQRRSDAGLDPTPPAFDEEAMLVMLTEALQRTIETYEVHEARHLWQRFGRLQKDLTARALQKVVHMHGQGLHIGYYLAAIAEEHCRLQELNADV